MLLRIQLRPRTKSQALVECHSTERVPYVRGTDNMGQKRRGCGGRRGLEDGSGQPANDRRGVCWAGRRFRAEHGLQCPGHHFFSSIRVGSRYA